MTTIFDDMGTLVIEDNHMKAYGTEIGAFVRTDDLENGYTYKVFDRAIFMNPSLSNARIVLPISSYDDITTGISVDYILYANNYEESANKIRLFDNVASALEVFKKGARVAKGTTGETGLVTTFFANPFGPVQLEEETNVLLDKYFNYFFDNSSMLSAIVSKLEPIICIRPSLIPIQTSRPSLIAKYHSYLVYVSFNLLSKSLPLLFISVALVLYALVVVSIAFPTS
jgi:hypothetical protein